MRLQNGKAELKQRVKSNITKYAGMFRDDCSCNKRFILTQNTKPSIFRIPKNQSISNTPSRCLNFRFSVKGLSNSDCLKGG